MKTATELAQKIADQELEACCAFLLQKGAWPWPEEAAELRSARRSKPPSLKDRALAIVENLGICDHLSPENERIIRSALNELPDN